METITSSKHSEHNTTLTYWLGRFLRVTLSDGRVFVGQYVAVDVQKNILLRNTEEIEPLGSRTVGMASVPLESIIKVEMKSIS
jgi:small nuclear ribonucleoprotein (snRNP)-like protein